MAQPQPRAQHQHPQHTQPYTYRRATAAKRRKKLARRRMLVGLGVLLVAVGVFFALAMLLGKGAEEPAPSAPPVASTPAVVASTPPVSVAQAPSVPQRQATPYDEDAAPPLFNYANAIPSDYSFDLVDVGGGQSMATRAAAAFTAMQKAAAEDGVTLSPVSGYRSNAQQTNNYNNSIQRYLDQGLSQEEALRRTQRYYAIPGTSEHEAGLAMDINLVDDSFADTPAYTWLMENGTRFGFIYRYQKDTEDITHIAWEPWHYRYVGANHAEAIEEAGITLEEYTESLQMG